MKVLALDQASITTGFAIFENGKLVDYGKFTFEDSDIAVRLVKIRNKVIDLIDKNNIDKVVFEEIQLQNNVVNNVKTFKVLAEVFGVVYELLSERKIKNTAVLPIKWKAHFKIAGKGRAQEKKMAQSYVMNNYNIACTEDEADSLCIALYHYDNSNVFDWS